MTANFYTWWSTSSATKLKTTPSPTSSLTPSPHSPGPAPTASQPVTGPAETDLNYDNGARSEHGIVAQPRVQSHWRIRDRRPRRSMVPVRQSTALSSSFSTGCAMLSNQLNGNAEPRDRRRKASKHAVVTSALMLPSPPGQFSFGSKNPTGIPSAPRSLRFCR
ncbi:hypothetical protein Mp_3g04070 [Marchantia polymorpha subsp. ruderalis]|uniref:Uncharacterized protein n=2 Tax=Marchantia polymorpha TaxID=3197 RepID=A0AAF6AX94_MARPO|nr:hypothetical protein MARPO_0022s0124 [Marchantia polymorpha]BBN04378.1 hypothetical protein Mp_3g04070 [Marchantia polymorpha subsp. ruderalis]|eukprot:PTQ44026.1 hypothetical protein MARPO_0022s0124 [Marchantia polymorpha]